MDGLIIKKKWLDLIFSGQKTWEIRGSNTKKRGRIALIESGSGEVKGFINLINSFPAKLKGNKNKHCLEHADRFLMKYKIPHAWVFEKPWKLRKPLKYNHPQGAVIWVKNV